MYIFVCYNKTYEYFNAGNGMLEKLMTVIDAACQASMAIHIHPSGICEQIRSFPHHFSFSICVNVTIVAIM